MRAEGETWRDGMSSFVKLLTSTMDPGSWILVLILDPDILTYIPLLLHINPTTFHVLYLEPNRMDSNVNKVFA